jgi:hypothetical protein
LPAEVLSDFAHQRASHSGDTLRSITARDEGLCRHQNAEDVFRGAVAACVRPVLHQVAQRKPLHAMQPLL